MTHRCRSFLLLAAIPFIAGAVWPHAAEASGMRPNGKRPALVITNDPVPGVSSRNMIMPPTSPVRTGPPASITPASRPYRTEEISAAQLTGSNYYDGTNTVVGQKIDDMLADLGALQNRVAQLDSKLNSIEHRNDGQSAEYYAAIATINTQLQAGTTPGNPRLVQRLHVAQNVLDTLGQNVADLNGLAVEIADTASMASFLMEATQSAYSLSGAVEEDHQRLAGLEDQVDETIAKIDRLLNNVNDDITRTAAYLNTERSNLRTLSLAVSNGDLYGKALSNRPFSSGALGATGMMQPASYGGMAASGSRPLVKIKFDKANVDFEQPVYMAVNDAMSKYPDARFEVIAVHPTGGNAAQVAIESTRARRNAEKVLRALTQMGLDSSRIDVSYAPSDAAATSEVHVNLR